MRVIYFHQYFSTPGGSGGIRSYAMAKRLVGRGHQVLMVCGSVAGGRTGLSVPFKQGRRRAVVDGIEVLEFDLAYSNSDSFIRRTVTFFKFGLRSIGVALTEKYELLFATTTPLTAGIAGICARWLRAKPFVFEVRDLWPELPRAMGVMRNPLMLWAMSLLEWASYRSADRLIGLSPGIVDGIARRGVDRSRIRLIPNGCDLGIFGAPVVPWRPEGVGANDLMAVFAGTHGMANGLDAVLDAAREVKRQGRPHIKILLIGDGKLKPQLQRRAMSEGLTNVIFHEPVSKARLAGLLAATDVGLQVLENVPAFYYGTSPNKFFDYFAAGLPVLINYPGWLAELVQEHECGYAVPSADPKAFADALIQATDHRLALASMGKRARALAQRRFDRQILADQFVDWLEGSLSK